AFEQLQRVAGLLALLDDAQRAIDDTLGDRLLAGLHYMVDELGQNLAFEFRIWKDFSLRSNATSWHRMFPLDSPPGGQGCLQGTRDSHHGSPALLILPQVVL